MPWIEIPEDKLQSIHEHLRSKWKRQGLTDKLPCPACGHSDYNVVPVLFQPELLKEWPSEEEIRVRSMIEEGHAVMIEGHVLSSLAYLIYLQTACASCGLTQFFLLGETLAFKSIRDDWPELS